MRFISIKAHTIIGLAVGIILLFAPSMFGFEGSEIASLVSRIVGVFIIVNELIATSPLSLFRVVPMRVHIVIDCLAGIVLFLSPWLFGFMNTSAANEWPLHLFVGVLVVGYALMTNVPESERVDTTLKNTQL